MCSATYTYRGVTERARVTTCSLCGEFYDHTLIDGRGYVTLGHKCPEWVEVYPDKWAPCERTTHFPNSPCIGEMVKDKRPRLDYNATSVKEVKVPEEHERMRLFPHQAEAVGKMKNGSILAGGVGVGKTFTALAYYAQIVCEGVLDRSEPMKKPRDLIVITTAKKRDDQDWHKEAISIGVFPDRENSYGNVELIVDSWNNIEKYVDRTDAFFIFDEQRVVGNGVWVKSFYKITKNNQWILLSATPADTWMDYIPVFVAHGHFKNRTDFIESHVIYKYTGKYMQIRGFYGVRHLERIRDDLLVEMPYERHTTRHLEAVPVLYDVETFKKVWKARWNVYEDQPLIDVAEMHRVGRKVVNSDPDRLVKIKELSTKHDKLIIFYNFDYELEALRTLHTELDIVVAEWNGHRHEDVPGTDRWLYLVQYQAGSEGWNCIETDAIIYYSLPYSHKNFEQSQGRIDRLNTPYDDLWYYILISLAEIDAIIWKSLLAKKNFHEGRNVKFVDFEPVKIQGSLKEAA